jgi:hypothetical protein
VHHSNHLRDRRTFLLESSAFALAASLPARLTAQSAKEAPSIPSIPSRDTLLKFNPDGSRRPFAGNTVICHLLAQGAMRDAVVALHEDLQQASFRPRLGLTPPDSYHMTVFAGANDQDRVVTGWPSYVPPDAPIATCNGLVGTRMAKAHLNCALPLRVRVDETYTLGYPTACTLRLEPADPEQNIKLRSMRDRLAEVYGFRSKNHDRYEFHMTLSYQLTPFTTQEQTAYRELLKRHLRQIVAAEPVIEFGNPEYCTFPDMYRFDAQKLLACSLG